MKSAFSVALIGAVAQSTTVDRNPKRVAAFNNIVASSSLNGKLLREQVPAVKKLIKPVHMQEFTEDMDGMG